MVLRILGFLGGGFIVLFMLWRIVSVFYTVPCPHWLGWLIERDNPFTRVNQAETIIQHLQLKPGMRVLDVGCGPGRVTIPVVQKLGNTGSVIAVDIQSEMLQKVQQKAQKLGLHTIRYIQAELGKNQIAKNEKFDRILLVTVIGEVPQKKQALAEVYSLLAHDGILSVTEVIFDPHFQRQSTIQSLAESVGLKKQAVFGSWYAYTMHFVKATN